MNVVTIDDRLMTCAGLHDQVGTAVSGKIASKHPLRRTVAQEVAAAGHGKLPSGWTVIGLRVFSEVTSTHNWSAFGSPASPFVAVRLGASMDTS